MQLSGQLSSFNELALLSLFLGQLFQPRVLDTCSTASICRGLMNLYFSACFLDRLDDFNTWSWNLISWSIENILNLSNYKSSAFCQRISQLHIIVTYVPNKWITYVLTISHFGNPWQNHNKQMSIWEKS